MVVRCPPEGSWRRNGRARSMSPALISGSRSTSHATTARWYDTFETRAASSSGSRPDARKSSLEQNGFPQDVGATCRDVLGRLAVPHESCRGHTSPRNRQRIRRRKEICTARSALLLFYTTKHVSRDRTREQKQRVSSFFLWLGW